MFRNVIIGIDERNRGADAIALARQLVDPDGRLCLAHVRTGFPLYAKGMTGALELEEREASLRLLADVSAATGISATESITAATVGRGLHELAERRGADLLVLGSTRYGLVGRVLVGDDTRAAISGAPCAVAVAPAAYADGDHAIHMVGIAYNDTDESRHALTVGRELAAAHGAQLSAFEAVTLPVYAYEGIGLALGAVVGDLVAAAAKRLGELDGVEPHAGCGDPVDELSAYSAGVDLLVVGSRGYGPLGRLVHSSTSLGLSHRARCPLLILTRAAGPAAEDSDQADVRAATAASPAASPAAA